MKAYLEAIKHQLHNGGRYTVILIIVLLSIIVVLTGINAYDRVGALIYQPFGHYSLQTIDAPRGPDNIPLVKLGQPIYVIATKCANQTVGVIVNMSYFRLGDYSKTVPAIINGVGIRQVGCKIFRFGNDVPAGVTPGLWKIVGREVAQEGIWQDQVYYESEPFFIIE